jgi:hypothetical protein
METQSRSLHILRHKHTHTHIHTNTGADRLDKSEPFNPYLANYLSATVNYLGNPTFLYRGFRSFNTSHANAQHMVHYLANVAAEVDFEWAFRVGVCVCVCVIIVLRKSLRFEKSYVEAVLQEVLTHTHSYTHIYTHTHTHRSKMTMRTSTKPNVC